ncbi:MAG: ATP-binding protein, partial [Mariprofundaceae bacterium]
FRDYVTSDWRYQGCESGACSDAGELTPGGLGLRLIEEVADRFEQKKLADGNRWCLVFCLGKTE